MMAGGKAKDVPAETRMGRWHQWASLAMPFLTIALAWLASSFSTALLDIRELKTTVTTLTHTVDRLETALDQVLDNQRHAQAQALAPDLTGRTAR